MTETGSMKHTMTYGEKGPRDILGISNHWTQGVPLRTPCILGGFKCIKCRVWRGLLPTIPRAPHHPLDSNVLLLGLTSGGQGAGASACSTTRHTVHTSCAPGLLVLGTRQGKTGERRQSTSSLAEPPAAPAFVSEAIIELYGLFYTGCVYIHQ